MPSELGYWDIRGLGQPLRFLLAYVGEEYEDKRYITGPGPEFNKSDWFDVKFKLGLPFPNLPYYMDDNVKITNTNAIFKYLGRKYKLDGETEKEKVDCDIGLEVIMDLRNGFVRLCYDGSLEKYKQGRDPYLKTAKAKIAAMDEYIGDRPFFCGAKVTVCDFHLYEMLDEHKILEPTILDDHPKLVEYCKRFEKLQGVKDLISSGKVKATPINNRQANFNS